MVKILEPPAEGHWYVYGFDIAQADGSTSAAWTLYDDDAGYPIAVGYAVANNPEHVVIGGERILGDLKLQSTAVVDSYCVRYNQGP